MEKVFTSQAPQPIGPYSQALVSGNFVFCSGQIALDPKSGQLIGKNVSSQTRQILTNLKAVLEQAGSSLDHVLKTTIYMTDLSSFSAFNEEYAQYFPTNPPARSTVQVSALPKGALIEIDLIAEIA